MAAKLISNDGSQLQWLVERIELDFERRERAWWNRTSVLNSAGGSATKVPDDSPLSCIAPLPDLIQISVELAPLENDESWTHHKTRIRAAVNAELRDSLLSHKRSGIPRRKRGTYQEHNRLALVLALCGVRWHEILTISTKSMLLLPCHWTTVVGPKTGAQRVAERLGLKWPLKLSMGRPRKESQIASIMAGF